jgi:hypothetical protein
MADYRELAAALGGGYGQDTGPITPDTLITLKNGKTASAGDLLGLLKGFGQSVGSNLESLTRGGVASVIGAGGDLESFGRMGINKLYGAGGVNVSETPVLPTSTDILGMMPRGTATRPETAGMEELGGYMTPATAKVLKPAATGMARMVGQEINAGLTGQPTRSLLGTITPKPKLLDVYHGTPHTLPPTERNPLGEFDASKIGTGEGAQAYGYGIYTAEARQTGERYRSQLAPERNASDLNTKMQFVKIGEKPINPDTFDVDVSQELIDAAKSGKKEFLDFANQKKSRWEQLAKDESYKFQPYAEEKVKAYDDLIKEAEKSGVKYTGAGNLYKIDLPDEKIATMMDWDKPLSQQSAQVKEALKGIEQDLPSIPDFDLKRWMETDPLASTWHNVLARDLKVEPFKISELLQNKGVAGIKYLDELSRGTKYKGDSAYLYAGKDFKENGYSLESALEGMKKAYKDANPQELKDALDAVYTPETRNFVVFPGEEKNMTILERNAEKSAK